MKILSNFLFVLCITIIVELVIVYLFGYRKKQEIIVIICINLITNPLLNYLLLLNHYFAFIKTNLTVIVFLELLVVLVEWRLLVYAIIGKSKKLFILSLLMNFCSYISGVLIINNFVASSGE
jgi:hypothetical protein